MSVDADGRTRIVHICLSLYSVWRLASNSQACVVVQTAGLVPDPPYSVKRYHIFIHMHTAVDAHAHTD